MALFAELFGGVTDYPVGSLIDRTDSKTGSNTMAIVSKEGFKSGYFAGTAK